MMREHLEWRVGAVYSSEEICRGAYVRHEDCQSSLNFGATSKQDGARLAFESHALEKWMLISVERAGGATGSLSSA